MEIDASTGARTKLIKGSAYGFDDPDAVSSDRTDVWVGNGFDASVTGFPT